MLLLRWNGTAALAVTMLYVGALGAVALYSVGRAHSGSIDFFISARLSYPTGYPNANAALFLTGFWVALMLATRRALPVGSRVLAAGLATALLQVALLSQSRGSLIAFTLTAVAVMFTVPGRWRTAVGVGMAVLIVALTWTTHTQVFDAALAGGSPLQEAIRRSAIAIAISAAAICSAVAVWGILDRRISITTRQQRLLSQIGLIGVGIALAAILAVATSLSPRERIRTGWSEFSAVGSPTNSVQHFSTGLGSNRYDFWRVSLGQFEERPLIGIGADNFSVPYLAERRSYEEPTYPHSLQVAVLSQLGIIGAVLLALFLGGVARATIPRKSDAPVAGAVAGAGFAGATYFFTHGSADWLWEIPGVTLPVFALLGMAASVRSSSASNGSLGVRRLGRPAALASALVGVMAASSLLLPWLSIRDTKAAAAVWREDPAAAYARLDRARSLNPLAADPDLIAGLISARLEDQPRMQTYFTRSLQREPTNWYAWLELGLAESVAGRKAAALSAIREARRLNPLEAVVGEVERRVSEGERIQPSSLDALFLERIASRTR